MKIIQKNTFISAITISFGVILSRFSGLIRDIFFAKYLGSGAIAEAFYVSWRLPNTFRRIFAEGAFSNAFVPFFSSKVKDNRTNANHFSAKIMIILLTSLIILTFLIEIFMPSIISVINPGFQEFPMKFDMAVRFSRIAFPYIIFISIASFFGSILNSIGFFWQFASISVLLNLTLLIGLLLTNNLFTNAGECLVWMLIIAGILQVIILSFSCIKHSVFPDFKKKTFSKSDTIQEKEDIKSFIKKLLPAIMSSGILQINIFIDGIFASFFAGAVSYLYYTDRIGQFPLSIIGYSLSVAILPSMSLAFKNNDKNAISNLQKQSLNVALFFSIPAMFLIFILSKQIITLIYQHGAFTEFDTYAVGTMLSIYAFAIPFNVLSKIILSCFYAQKNTKIPLKISLLSLCINIICNLILFKIIGQYCIIVATTIAEISSCVFAFVLLKKQNNFFIKIKDLKLSLKIIIISSISCLFVPMFLRQYLHLIFTLFICGVIFLILCLMFKIITKDFIESFLKKN